MTDPSRLDIAIETCTAHLLSAQNAEGYWEGRLSSSGLATATACSALRLGGDPADERLIQAGLAWLRADQNEDGGWGDSPDSPSNISTTLLGLATFALSGIRDPNADRTIARAYDYAADKVGRDPAEWVKGITRVYGKDRTFAVPILMNCGLAGLVRWEDIPGLPYELAAVPAELYRFLKLHVVSYALPALIAIGMLLHKQAPSWNPLARLVRWASIPRVLRKLAEIQPSNGGYLEATPLISFVTMSLFARFPEDPPQVALKARQWIRDNVRADGAWPIDANLSIWVTTNSLTALEHAGQAGRIDVGQTRDWLFAQQLTEVHPFTNAAPGAWGWSHLPGSVPDADDTPGAIYALALVTKPGDPDYPRLQSALPKAVKWLLDLQNGDGGWPTFCKGWGQLPFDQSAADITAHCLRALRQAGIDTPRVRKAQARGHAYLSRTQRPNGSWVPLWFGNQYEPALQNPVFGTARVVLAYAEMDHPCPEAERGLAYLVGTQNADGGWGGAPGLASTVEETALVLAALTAWPSFPHAADPITRGTAWLLARVEDGTWTATSPIGLYFSVLWYGEDLYPVTWTLDALGRVRVALVEPVSSSYQQDPPTTPSKA